MGSSGLIAHTIVTNTGLQMLPFYKYYTIKQRCSILASYPGGLGWNLGIPAFPIFFRGKSIDVAYVNQWSCITESRLWLENVDRTHLVLASAAELQKDYSIFNKFQIMMALAGVAYACMVVSSFSRAQRSVLELGFPDGINTHVMISGGTRSGDFHNA